MHPSDQVSISAEDTTVGDALTDLLAKQGLMFLVEGQQLIVTSPDRKAAKPATVSTKFTILLRTGREDLARLTTMVVQFVVPASWQENGGKGRVKAADRSLVVEQDLFVQRDMAMFLDKLRQTRALPVKGNLKPEDVAAKVELQPRKSESRQGRDGEFRTRYAAGRSALLVGAGNWHAILIDEASLSQAGLWSHVPAKVVADHQPLFEVLARCCRPSA